jgi:hypothetical protein
MSSGTSKNLLPISYVRRCALTIRLLWLFQSNSPSERKNPLQIYGFVYGEKFLTPKGINVTDIVIDVATGVVKDLNVTVKVEYTQKN